MDTRKRAAPVRDEKRRTKRHLTVLIVGKVTSDRGEFACLVNNVSRGGLRARFPRAPMLEERLTIALRGLSEMNGTVRWVDGNTAGIEFDRPIKVTEILTKYGATRKPRAPRFACNRPTDFILDGHECAIDLIDVSLGGAKLSLHGPVSDVVGHAGTLILPHLDQPRAGTVRWAGGDRIGFQFATPLPLDTLATLLSRSA